MINDVREYVCVMACIYLNIYRGVYNDYLLFYKLYIYMLVLTVQVF